VAEALWKQRPVVAGNVGGIPLQVEEGVSGYLVNTVEECAERVLELLRNPDLAERMGRAGREHVRRNFLITRYLRDYLRIFRDQSRAAAVVPEVETGEATQAERRHGVERRATAR
jgi:trehalose synthase